AAMALIREAVEAVRANSTPSRMTEMCDPVSVEGVVDGGVHAEKALCGSSRLEPLQLAFASSHRLMRVLRSIVSRSTGAVHHSRASKSSLGARRRAAWFGGNAGFLPCYFPFWPGKTALRHQESFPIPVESTHLGRGSRI